MGDFSLLDLMETTLAEHTNLEILGIDDLPSFPSNEDLEKKIEGSKESWPASNETARLPEFTSVADQKSYVEIFNKGKGTWILTFFTKNEWYCPR